MINNVLQQAIGRLEHARRAERLLREQREDPFAFQANWLDFLVQWKGTYTKVQQAAKSSPQEIQWFGTITKARRADPLLRYLFEARNDGEHGINPSTFHLPAGFKFIATDTAQPKFHFDSSGALTSVTDTKGNEIVKDIQPVPEQSFLIEVTEFDGVKKVPPPKEHLGTPMEPKPLIAAALGLQWLENLVETAEAMQAPSP